MSDFFLGQIMMTGFQFAPKYFAACNGQLLPIQQNQALFSLLGTQFGGNGVNNFQLPDMRGRTPLGYGSSVSADWQPPQPQMGQQAGTETVSLNTTHLPSHQHTINANNGAGTTRNPRNGELAQSAGAAIYAAPNNTTTLHPATLTSTGGGQAHPNLQPYTVLNFCIALSGIFPSRN